MKTQGELKRSAKLKINCRLKIIYWIGPVGSADTQIAYPQQFKDKYPADTNTALRVRYRSPLHRLIQMKKMSGSVYVICGFLERNK